MGERAIGPFASEALSFRMGDSPKVRLVEQVGLRTRELLLIYTVLLGHHVFAGRLTEIRFGRMLRENDSTVCRTRLSTCRTAYSVLPSAVFV